MELTYFKYEYNYDEVLWTVYLSGSSLFVCLIINYKLYSISSIDKRSMKIFWCKGINNVILKNKISVVLSVNLLHCIIYKIQ